MNKAPNMIAETITERMQAAILAKDAGRCAALIVEAEKAAHAANEEHEKARNHALDPLLSIAESDAARKEMDDALFRRDRLTRGAEMLREKVAEFRDADADGERRDRYAKAMFARNAAVSKLLDRYPAIAQELGTILNDVIEADRLVRRVNADLPKGALRLEQQGRDIALNTRLPAMKSATAIWAPGRSIGGAMEFHPEHQSAPAENPGGADGLVVSVSPGTNKQKEAA